MSAPLIDKRLSSVGEYVRAGAVLADIGTDHGYLPIFLLTSGRISRAVLSDINEGPLASARQNAERSGVIDRCELVLCDGASALDGRGITDFAVAGMGGELIADIVSNAPCMQREGIRLILQPMTRPACLRERLASLGFNTLIERYAAQDGRYYVIIVAEFSGQSRRIDFLEAELGPVSQHSADRDEFLGYMRARLNSLRRAKQGRLLGGEDADEQIMLIEEIERRINDLKG